MDLRSSKKIYAVMWQGSLRNNDTERVVVAPVLKIKAQVSNYFPVRKELRVHLSVDGDHDDLRTVPWVGTIL